MDPNEALTQARKAAAVLKDCTDLDAVLPAPAYDALESLVMHFEALDQWLSRDGFLPEDWKSDDEKAVR